MPPPEATRPDDIYRRPCIPPWTAELQRQFAEVCGSGDFEKVAEIVDSESHSQEYLREGLCAAIDQKDVRIVDFLLKRGASIDLVDVPGAAASAKSIPVFKLLLEHGWDINAPILGEFTLLTRILDDEEITKWFLDHGAQPYPPPRSFNPSAAKVFKSTPGRCLSVAASISSIVTFDLLIQHGAKGEDSLALHMAAGAGMDDERIPMMAHLIDLGYDVNATDEPRGHRAIGTPLHYALSAKSLAKVKFLLQRGADPNKPVGLAGSAFNLAERTGMDKCVILMKQIP